MLARMFGIALLVGFGGFPVRFGGFVVVCSGLMVIVFRHYG
jgi:hypothetical protein